LNLTVTGTYAGADDARGVEDRKDEIIDYTGNELANCYMVHPAPAGSGITRTYRIPIQRINDYWTGTADGYGASTANGATYSNNRLTVGEAWNASVLWSDMTAITTATPITASGNYTGVRSKDYFSFRIPAGTAAGNFVVQVKDATNTILWSWHLWVTDYEADLWRDGTVNSVPNASYAVFGGQVDSYGGTVWQSGGILSGKVMMDRNLGAIERGTNVTATSRGQLYYQWGRKDPLPRSLDGTSTLQLTGSGTFPKPVVGPIKIAVSVQAPTTFYYSTNVGNWTSDATGATYLWNDPNAPRPDVDVHQKSIYDPCPAGWRLPELVAGTNSASPWYGFTLSRFITYAYTATGFRFHNSGILDYVEGGYYRSASPYDSKNGLYMSFDSSSVSPQNFGCRASGTPVRCSQQ
jgi:hypothetical protein